MLHDKIKHIGTKDYFMNKRYLKLAHTEVLQKSI